MIRAMTVDDWPAVREIYGEGIASRIATLETAVPSWSQWDAVHLPQCRLVAVEAQRVVAWAALSAVSRREVYRGVAEVSVYVASSVHGRGFGRALLYELVLMSEKAGIWTLQAGIFPENEVSLALHQRCGFRVVGCRERIGCRDGRWKDILLVERRSAVVGVGDDRGGSLC